MQIPLIFTASVLLLAYMISFTRHILYFMRNNPRQSASQLCISQWTEKDEASLNILEVNVTLLVCIIITTH